MVQLLELLHDGQARLAGRRARTMLEHLKKCDDKEKFPRFLPPGTVGRPQDGLGQRLATDAGIIYIDTARPGRRVRADGRERGQALGARQRRQRADRQGGEGGVRPLHVDQSRPGQQVDFRPHLCKDHQSMAKPLNIGMIGYGFMGRAHSNAYRKVNHFFDLDVSGRCSRPPAPATPSKAKAFADQWGYESIETDWRKLHRAQGHRRDRHLHAEQHCTRRSPSPRRPGGQDDPVREAAGDERAPKGEEMVEAVEKAERAEHGLVQLPPRARPSRSPSS